MRITTGEALDAIRRQFGRMRLITSRGGIRPYCTGIRFGAGRAVAVLRPGSLVELWRMLEICVRADLIIIPQAANTGLTGGSTPDGTGYDRDVVVISMQKLAGIHMLREGRQVICLPGATLHALEEILAPYGREPHSVIGSSCIGASVIGGVCNNSGGALVRRGPAYTELALYARVDEARQLQLINRLGVRLEGEPEQMLASLERGRFDENDCLDPAVRASMDDYESHVRNIGASTPARYNADPRGLHEASGCAGKVVVIAVRLDTFPRDRESRTFYIGSNDADEFTRLRRHMLSKFKQLPVAAEYLHREAFDIAAAYGKDIFLGSYWFGTDRLERLFRWKVRIDRLAAVLGVKFGFADRVLQRIASWLPSHLPPRMGTWRNRYEHHLLLKMADDGIDEARTYLGSVLPSASGDFFECSNDEATKAFLHRYVTAGAATRYRLIHSDIVEDIVALDTALPRDAISWVERLPSEIEEKLIAKLYYGHFFCHVFHQDYVVAKGNDPTAIEHTLWALLDARGAEYPAEHNVGHLYAAKPTLRDHYRRLDPCNAFNPGIGQTSKHVDWQ